MPVVRQWSSLPWTASRLSEWPLPNDTESGVYWLVRKTNMRNFACCSRLLPDKDKVYFNDYSTLVQQQGMLQDHVRTSLYQFSMLENRPDFAGQTVLDVGAGTGILSFFAAQAGAAKVYAVEASGMARHAEKLAAGNGLSDVVQVLNQRVEEVKLDAKVDVRLPAPLATRASRQCMPNASGAHTLHARPPCVPRSSLCAGAHLGTPRDCPRGAPRARRACSRLAPALDLRPLVCSLQRRVRSCTRRPLS